MEGVGYKHTNYAVIKAIIFMQHYTLLFSGLKHFTPPGIPFPENLVVDEVKSGLQRLVNISWQVCFILNFC